MPLSYGKGGLILQPQPVNHELLDLCISLEAAQKGLAIELNKKDLFNISRCIKIKKNRKILARKAIFIHNPGEESIQNGERLLLYSIQIFQMIMKIYKYVQQYQICQW